MTYAFSDYEKCLFKLKEVFGGCEGILSIMQFGNVSVPGQSDIDLIFVIENNPSLYRDIINRFETEFTEREKYLIFQHYPYFVPEEIVHKINIIRPCSNIKHIYGKEYEIQQELDIYCKTYMLVELLTNYYPSYLTSFRDIRLNLQIINAFRFVLDLYCAIAGDFELDISFCERVKGLLKENDHIRTAEGIDCASVKKFIKISQRQLIDVIFLMFEQLDHVLGKCMKEEYASLKRKVYRGKIFSKKKKRFYVLKVFGRTFNLMHYPLRFYYLFGDHNLLIDELREKIDDRNQVLEAYKNFCFSCAGGSVFYFPWWMKWNISRHSQIKKIFLQGLALL